MPIFGQSQHKLSILQKNQVLSRILTEKIAREPPLQNPQKTVQFIFPKGFKAA
jgi:hypothetical protein